MSSINAPPAENHFLSCTDRLPETFAPKKQVIVFFGAKVSTHVFDGIAIACMTKHSCTLVAGDSGKHLKRRYHQYYLTDRKCQWRLRNENLLNK